MLYVKVLEVEASVKCANVLFRLGSVTAGVLGCMSITKGGCIWRHFGGTE